MASHPAGRPVSAFLRSASTRQLLLVIAAALALVAGGAAAAVAATQDTATPPPIALAGALRAALAGAHQVQGLTADVNFTNDLITGSSIEGSDPLLTGASGRLWASADGRVRLELQSDNGDVEIICAGGLLTVSDPTSHTVYELRLPAGSGGGHDAAIPSVAAIQSVLGRIGADVTISPATPSNVAGREAYTVTASPRSGAGLVGEFALAFDAANGTPLRIAVYAHGDSSPVLALELTAVSYGPVDDGVFAIPPAPGDRIVELGSAPSATGGAAAQHPATGAGAVQPRLAFTLSDPAALAGLARSGVRLVSLGSRDGALVTYGTGLGTIVVLEADGGGAAPGGAGGGGSGMLPTVSVGGSTGHELATPLGTIVTFERAGVTYAVAGSVSSATALAAARGL